MPFLLNEPETLFASNNIIMSLEAGFYVVAIYSFIYQVISSELYVSLVTADNNKFLHCISKELQKYLLTTSFRVNTNTTMDWENFNQGRMPNFGSIFIEVSTKLNKVGYE